MDESEIYIAIFMLFMAVIVGLSLAFDDRGPKCPKCGTANTVQRLNFVSDEDRKAFYAHDTGRKIETFVDCKKCGHRYVQTLVLEEVNMSGGGYFGGD